MTPHHVVSSVCSFIGHNDAMRTLGVHHVSINVDDVAAALDFYVGVLGLNVRDDRPQFEFDGAWLDAGDGQQVHLIAGTVPEYRGQHFAFRVDDLDAVVEEVRGRGLEVTDPRPVGPGRQAFMRDPSGNRVELNQPG
jgi:catechol 2,3-dioxygenase-like lactoylglutathione lyase family enzyme